MFIKHRSIHRWMTHSAFSKRKKNKFKTVFEWKIITQNLRLHCKLCSGNLAAFRAPNWCLWSMANPLCGQCTVCISKLCSLQVVYLTLIRILRCSGLLSGILPIYAAIPDNMHKWCPQTTGIFWEHRLWQWSSSSKQWYSMSFLRRAYMSKPLSGSYSSVVTSVTTPGTLTLSNC